MSDEKILIIDDSAELVSLLESILPYSGYQTISAATGEEGLNLALALNPDVILVDLELPDRSGLQFLEELNRHQVSIPTIMMTGYGSEGVAARALRLGALSYLIKPFTTEEVLTSVDRALAVKRLGREKAQLTALLDAYTLDFRLISVLDRALIEDLELDQFFQRVVEAASFTTRAERCLLFLLDAASSELQIVAGWGKAPNVGYRCSPRMGDEHLRPVLEEGTSVRLQASPGSRVLLQSDEAVRTVLQVPLRARDQVVGLLSVDRQGTDLPFGRHEEQILAVLADYAVMALEKQRLTERTATVPQSPAHNRSASLHR